MYGFFLHDFMTDTDIKHSHRCVGAEWSLNIHLRSVLLILTLLPPLTALGLCGRVTILVTTMTNAWLAARSEHHIITKQFHRQSSALTTAKNKLQKLPNMQNILFSKECH